MPKNTELTIATAPKRTSKHWTNTHTDIQELTMWAADPKTIPYTQTEYHALPKGEKDNAKDVGGFVAGHLKAGIRRKGHVISRSLITLDIDNLPADLSLQTVLDAQPYAWLAHTTLSHTPNAPRWRLWIWLQRNITPDEYGAISRRLAQDINPGLEWFDPSTFEPERFMYWPATTQDGDYHCLTSTGKPDLDPDDILARFETWQDLTTWPGISPDQAHAIHNGNKTSNPLEKPGMMGAFNRAWPIDKAITHFLPEVYKPGTTPNRWTYTEGTSSNGLIIYNAGTLCYSQHSTDPAADGHTHSAFDLVRIHQYGHLDHDPTLPANKQPSYIAMMELATTDPATRGENAKATAATINQAFDIIENQKEETPKPEDPPAPSDPAPEEPEKEYKDAWLAELETRKNGTFTDTITNFELIFTNDPRLNHIAWNAHAGGLQAQDPQALPWKQLKPGWTDNDDAMLKTTIANTYEGLYAPTKMHDALLSVASKRAFHPVRDYFSHLPPWDGIQRLDTLLIDYLGAEDTDYTRAVTRKTLVAAHRRTFKPGTKFDQVLTLCGPQGVGKSTLFAKLGGQWFSDSLTITDMRDKTAAEKLAGNLIVEIPELTGMRKADAETVKSFISRNEDKYRPAYGRTVETYPRQCIIVGTTNARDGFLRDSTGNRRWWVVTITGESPMRVQELNEPTLDQIWAEARYYDRQGEKLFLEGEILETAQHIQAENVEADDRVGLVEKYLNLRLPSNWDHIPLCARRAYVTTCEMPEEYAVNGIWDHSYVRTTVSKIEIWAECFGRDPHDMRRIDSNEITAIMSQINGWEDNGSRKYVEPYGRQRVFDRVEISTPVHA